MANGNTVIFNPTIKPKPITYKLVEDDGYNQEFARGIGYIPFVWYNGLQIEYNDIINFQLYTSDNIPTLNLTFKDSLGLMKSTGMPLDDTIISIFINSRSKNVKSIHLDFKVTSFSESNSIYTISGVVDVDDFYVKFFKSYSKKTSFDVYKEICKTYGLGYASNFTNTNDAMTWINPGNTLLRFMNELIFNSWRDKSTFLYAFMDFHYFWNFIDIEKEIKRDIKEELGILNSGEQDLFNVKSTEENSKLYVTNDINFVSSNMYFEKYQVINSSTETSIRVGYLTQLSYYDELQKSFLVFKLDSLQGDKATSYSLRGKQNDTGFFKKNINIAYDGKFDLDNVHRDFKYAPYQNKINYSEIEKIKVIITMKTPNFNLKRFQKIYALFSNNVEQVSRPLLNPRLTGEWIITDIIFSFVGGEFRQKVELSHRELKKAEGEETS